MTEPLPIGPTAEQLSIELAAAAQITAELRRQLQQATNQIISLYVGAAGGVNQPLPPYMRDAFANAAARIIANVDVDIRLRLWDLVLQALAAGRSSALPFIQDLLQDVQGYSQMLYDQTLAAAQRARTPPETTAQWAAMAVAAIQSRLNANLQSARAAPTVRVPPADFNDVMVWINQAESAARILERDARWLTNAAFNQASREVSDMAGVDRIWIAERDACLHCLALSGHRAHAGQPYDASLTFYVGPEGFLKPLPVYPPGPLWGPPRHPNCRCFQRPVPVLAGYPLMSWETGPAYTPAMALQREARRSVLRGTSGSDSEPARLRAVSALLAAGVDLPVTVKRRARAALRRGGFE